MAVKAIQFMHMFVILCTRSLCCRGRCRCYSQEQLTVARPPGYVHKRNLHECKQRDCPKTNIAAPKYNRVPAEFEFLPQQGPGCSHKM
jgi:hypothetical protein